MNAPREGLQPVAAAASASEGGGAARAPRTRLRAITGEDHAAVQALFRRHGWPVRSRAGWDWALIHNPARQAVGADAGWVLEHGDQVVGFLGNLPVRCRYDGHRLWGATCTSYLVDDAHRGHSTRLIRAFAAQPGASFVYSATANPHSAPVYRGFRFRAATDPRVDQRLRWVASDAAVATYALQRAGLGLLAPLGRLLADVPSGLRRLRDGLAMARGAAGLRVERLAVEDLALPRDNHWPRTWSAWARTLSSQKGLWIDRSAATVAWRLSDPDLAEDLALWAVREADGPMLGMCMARKLPQSHGVPPKAELVDLALLHGAPPAAAALLLRQVLGWARSWGVAVIDAKRWTGEPAELLEQLRPRRDPLPAGGVWLMTHQDRGGPTLPDWPAWSMTGCDSDDWFCSHLLEVRENVRPWTPAPQPSAADSSAVRSATDSTSDGSNRNMSTA